jgi:uncharacterized membrane protein YdjX (TVP38/TMEM64 family)
MVQQVRIWVRNLRHFVDRLWYFPAVGLLAGLDLFILIVPTDAILITSVMMRPRKWIQAFLWVGLGSSLGALALAGAIQWDPSLVMDRLFPGAFETEVWRWMDAFFDNHGSAALLLIAISPLVQFPAVGIAALAGMPLWDIFITCFAGRMIKTAAFSYGASHAPKLLMKLPFIKQEVAILDPETAAALAPPRKPH